MIKNCFKQTNLCIYRRTNILLFIVLLTSFFLLSACGPSSPFVYILGKDIENFVDKTVDQKEPAKLTGEYLFLYLEKPDRFSKKQGANRDKVRLYLKNTATGKVETIFEGKLSIDIEYGFILSKSHTVLFTRRDWLIGDDNTYLYTYNYEKNTLIRERILIFEYKKDTTDKIRLGGPFLDDVDLCVIDTSLCTRVRYVKDVGDRGYYAWDFYIVDLKTGTRKAIDEQTYRKLSTESHLNSAVKYESIKNGKKIKLFSVYQYHDRIRENPKPKYNGIYINDGKNNIRISRIDGYELLKSKPIWVDDDRKVIIGKYLVDIEGKQKTSIITDKDIDNAKLLYAVAIKPEQ